MKQGKTIEEQLQILESRSLSIKNREQAALTLKNINYYTLTGYLFPFKNKKTGNYSPDASIELAINRYYLDSELRNMLLSFVSEAEELLKTRVAYHIAINHKDDPLIYTDISYWRDSDEYRRFMDDFHKSISNNSQIPFVKHHIQNYRGQFPIWVAVNLFSLGNLKYLYKNMPSKDRKNISRDLNLSPATLDSWIDVLRILRNKLAHNMRLYGVPFMKTPKWEKHHNKIANTNKLFINFVLLKYLLKDMPIWEDCILGIEKIIEKYTDHIKLTDLGFPTDWKDYL